VSSITQAKAEAQKLIKRYNQLQAEAKNANAIESRHKATEADKLVSQISALQLAITKLQAKDRENNKKSQIKKTPTPEKTERVIQEKSQVIDRIHHLEEAQNKTQAQIEQLTRARAELNRLKQQANKHAATIVKERRANDEKLQQELAKLIKKKEEEQSTLKQELVSVKQQAQKDAELLKVQRDAARSMMERQKNLETAKADSPNNYKKLFIVASVIAILALLLGIIIASMFTKPSVPSSSISTNTTKHDKSVGKKITKKIKTMEIYRDKLKTIPIGPLMIKLPSGTFKMGSKLPYSDERPQHKVKLDNFSISKYEVTFEEYDWFAGATGKKLPDDNNWGRGKRPVINVSWYNAVAYTEWLSEQTGYTYRLPSEREWEYAAAANSETTYWWGYKLEKNYANCAICGSEWDGRQTSPVGSFKANKFGLHDVIGNVMEWTLTCFRSNYQDAPNTGNIWEWDQGNCLKFVARSSSYKSYERELRTTKRNKFSPNETDSKIGFRVVREN